MCGAGVQNKGVTKRGQHPITKSSPCWPFRTVMSQLGTALYKLHLLLCNGELDGSRVAEPGNHQISTAVTHKVIHLPCSKSKTSLTLNVSPPLVCKVFEICMYSLGQMTGNTKNANSATSPSSNSTIVHLAATIQKNGWRDEFDWNTQSQKIGYSPEILQDCVMFWNNREEIDKKTRRKPNFAKASI